MGTFDDTIGVLFVGLLVSVALWGVSCTQTWNYYRDFPKDGWVLKSVVAIAWAADTIHQMLISHMMYSLLISDFAHPQKLVFIVKSLPISIPFVQVAATCVQGFYAYRIWRLSSSVSMTVGVAVINAAQFALAIAYTVRTMDCQTFVDLNMRVGKLTLAYSGMDAVNDVIITSIMCWLLYSHRAGHNRTNTIVNRLIFFAFSTGFLTTVSAVGLLLARIALPVSPVYLFFYFVIGRLYVNSLMASLNMRAQLRFYDMGHTKASTMGPIRVPGTSSFKDTLDQAGHEMSIVFTEQEAAATDTLSSTLYSDGTPTRPEHSV